MRRVKPIKKETPEETLTRNREGEKIKAAQKQKRIDKLEFENKARNSHDWHSEMNFDRLSSKGRPYPQYCKKCGLNFDMFKVKPQICPNDENNSK